MVGQHHPHMVMGNLLKDNHVLGDIISYRYLPFLIASRTLEKFSFKQDPLKPSGTKV